MKEKTKEKIKKAIDIFAIVCGIAVIITVAVLVFYRCGINTCKIYTPDTLHYLTSTIAQTVAAIMGVLGAVTLYKLQSINNDVGDFFLKYIDYEFIYDMSTLKKEFREAIYDYRQHKLINTVLDGWLKQCQQDDMVNAQNQIESIKESIKDNRIPKEDIPTFEKDISNYEKRIKTLKNSIYNPDFAYYNQIMKTKTVLLPLYKQKCNVIDSLKDVSSLAVITILVSVFFLINTDAVVTNAKINITLISFLILFLMVLTMTCIYRFLHLITNLVDH